MYIDSIDKFKHWPSSINETHGVQRDFSNHSIVWNHHSHCPEQYLHKYKHFLIKNQLHFFASIHTIYKRDQKDSSNIISLCSVSVPWDCLAAPVDQHNLGSLWWREYRLGPERVLSPQTWSASSEQPQPAGYWQSAGRPRTTPPAQFCWTRQSKPRHRPVPDPWRIYPWLCSPNHLSSWTPHTV